MSINPINSVTNTYTSVSATMNKTDIKSKTELKNNDDAVVYEKSSSSSSKGKVDQATIDKLKADSEARNQQLQSLVQKMFAKQGKTFSTAEEMYALLRSGNYEVDPSVKAQAQEDISEDGYWGVEQTSDRLVSFAQALSGGDTEKADELIEAIKKGFEQATEAWGDKLPDICQRTLDTTIEKMEKWRDGIE